MHGWMLHPKVFKNNILYLNSEQSIDFLYFSRFKLAADVGILSAPDILTYITMRLISQRLRHQHWSCCTANFIFVLVLTAPVCHPWCNNHFSSITWKSNSRRLKSDLTFIKNLSSYLHLQSKLFALLFKRLNQGQELVSGFYLCLVINRVKPSITAGLYN